MINKMIRPLLASSIATLSLATSLHAGGTAKTPDFDYKLKPKQVSSNVWCFFGALEAPTKENAGNMNNSCYIKTKDSWVLWDTGTSYVFAKQAYEAMTKVAGKKIPVTTILISHEHDDHWLGNNYYKEVHGATIMGPESFNEHYKPGDKTRMFEILPENAIRGTKIVPVDKSNKDGFKFTLSGVKFEYVPVSKAHSVEDYFMYMPDNKLILAGDIVMNGRITSNRDGSVRGQIEALNKINSKEWTALVPGHGLIIDKTAADESNLYFKLMEERVQAAIDDGVDATKINEVVTLPEFKDKAMYDLLNAHNVGFAFEELQF